MADLSGTFVANFLGPEGASQSGDIATFTDANLTDTVADFSASIVWGDGTTSSGVITSSGPGSFTVSGTHTYADEGAFIATATLTRISDQAQAAPGGVIQVTDADIITPVLVPQVFHTNPNQPFSGAVATFDDANLSQVASDLTATIVWGDGTTDIGTVTGGAGSFTVSGTHTYTTVGQDTVSVTLSDDAPGVASATAFATAAVGFAGMLAPLVVTEGLPVTAGTPIATFIDPDFTDSAANFTATIDWGDGTTTSGIVNGVLGAITVSSAGHTYADEGSFTPIVTLTHTADNVTGTVTGTITVLEGDIITPVLPPQTFHTNPNQPFSGAVATFSDSNITQVASDLTATIVWGDGTTDIGTVTGGAGSFTVSGTHTYTTVGQDLVSVALSDDSPGAASATVITTAAVGFTGMLAPFLATEGQPIAPGTPIATFIDPDLTDTAANFTASIDWGDGTTTPGVVGGILGAITVSSAGHTYADEGSFTPIVTLTHIADQVTGTVTGTVSVAEGDTLLPNPLPPVFHVNPNQSFTGVVGTFIDPTNPSQLASDFTATINWGDGSPLSVGTITGTMGGPFTVSGTHTYAAIGPDTVTVTLTDDTPGTATATAISTAVVGFPGSLSPLVATEGVPIALGTPVATFVDPDLSDTAASFTASINWGDGTTTPGVVVTLPGTILVSSTGHTYADEGSFTPIVTLTHIADNVTGTATGTVTVAEADVLTALPAAPIAPKPSQPFTAVMGTFADTNLAQVASDLTATIDWGDGTTSTGTVTGGGGLFSVSGTHTYATSGIDTIVTTLRDDAPGTASASIVRSNVMVGFPGAFALNAATEAMPIPANTTVATFSDPDLGDTASGFTATVDWGDGITTTGTVVGGAGLFAVDGGHTYRVEGNFQATATLTRISDNDTGVAKGTIAVAEGPTIPDDFAGTGLSGVLWRQTNPQSFAQNFVQWSMNGVNVAASQSDTFQGNVILPDASWSVRGTGDFNGDGKSDILWQHADGSLTAWLMNDSTIVSDGPLKSQGQIVAPNASWSVAGTGDFDGDGRDDILWRKTDGSLVEWLMNGTTISSTQAPTFQGNAISPDASWNIAAMGDFDGDGHQDIVWRNSSSSALQEWSMNGGTITSSQAPTFQGSTVTPDSSWSIVAAGDFNADGKTDLLWRQAGTGLLQEWQMNGSQITSSQTVKFQGSQVTPDASWSLVEIGDFNGDGKSDVLWRQTTTGALSEWQMDGAQITASNTVTPALDQSWQVQSRPTVFA